MLENISEASKFLRHKLEGVIPDFAIVIGSGLGGFEQLVDRQWSVPFGEIPGFPKTTVQGHKGSMIFGQLGGKNLLIMSGRFHYYEGHSMKTVTMPIRVFGQLGIKHIVLSNASGGVNPNLKVGDLVAVRDHINYFPEHPLRGEEIPGKPSRFLDMLHAYDPGFLELAENIAREHGLDLKKGIYFGISGPSFETPAEYNMVKIFGADIVGMSTVPEVIVARHEQMRVFCLSVVADIGGPEMTDNVTHDKVLQAVGQATPKAMLLVKELIERCNF